MFLIQFNTLSLYLLSAMGMPPLRLQTNKPSGMLSGPKRELILKHISAVMISDIKFHNFFFFFLHFKVGFKIKLLLWVFNLEEGKATHSGILAWRIPWTEETGGLQSIGSQRVRHD